jgi:hypothetical protein
MSRWLLLLGVLVLAGCTALEGRTRPQRPSEAELGGAAAGPAEQVEGVLRYFAYLDALRFLEPDPKAALAEELERMERLNQVRPGPALRVRLAWLLALEESGRSDPGRALALLTEMPASGDDARSPVDDLAALLASVVRDRQAREQKVDVVARQRRALGSRLRREAQGVERLGDRVASLEEEVVRLEAENAALREQIEALTSIEKRMFER